ncbi:MAG TPA: FecR family protein, partial [Gammaproteobacteria bacterium]|nr:FecR family protein [Gammaproteobacteria bacterium]
MRTQKRIDALKYSPRFLHFAPALLLVVVAASSHAGSNAVRDADGSRISVTAVAGDVNFTMAGNAVAVAPNATVLLPARIVTGHDGTVGLTQAGTNVSVSSDTDVEIPAEAVDGNLIARLVQHRGNVFYDVAPRDLGKLRVETPYLVAVIKGTQFNVAVQPDSTTISLFEGRLEIRTPDNNDVVQLNAGEIAIRSLIDNEIRVIGMDDARL